MTSERERLSTMVVADMRQDFERWAAKNPQRFPIAPLKNGVYPDLRTQCTWEGWKR